MPHKRRPRSFLNSVKRLDLFAQEYKLNFDRKGPRGHQSVLGSVCSMLLIVVFMVVGAYVTMENLDAVDREYGPVQFQRQVMPQPDHRVISYLEVSEDVRHEPVKLGKQIGFSIEIVDTRTGEMLPYDVEMQKYLKIEFTQTTNDGGAEDRKLSLPAQACDSEEGGLFGTNSICPKGLEDVVLAGDFSSSTFEVNIQECLTQTEIEVEDPDDVPAPASISESKANAVSNDTAPEGQQQKSLLSGDLRFLEENTAEPESEFDDEEQHQNATSESSASTQTTGTKQATENAPVENNTDEAATAKPTLIQQTIKKMKRVNITTSCLPADEVQAYFENKSVTAHLIYQKYRPRLTTLGKSENITSIVKRKLSVFQLGQGEIGRYV